MAFSKTFKSNTLSPLTVKVLDTIHTTKVSRWRFEDDEVAPLDVHINTTAAITDGETVLKFIVLGELRSLVTAGKCLVIRNYSLSRFGKKNTVLSKHTTTIYDCNPFSVPEHLEEEGSRILRPVSTKVRLCDLKQTDHYLVNVEGVVSRMEPMEKRKDPSGLFVPKRTIHIKQEDTEVMVELWREANLVPVSTGLPIKISHLGKNKTEKGNIYLSSTQTTEVNVMDGNFTTTIKGIRILENYDREVLDDNFIPIVVPSGLWIEVFGEEPTIPEKVVTGFTGGKLTRLLKFEGDATPSHPADQ